MIQGGNNEPINKAPKKQLGFGNFKSISGLLKTGK